MNRQNTDTRSNVQGTRFKIQALRHTPCLSKGFTLIELIVTITIIVILAGMLLTRIWFYQEQAEKAAMEQVAGALQSSLVMQYAKLLTSDMEGDVKYLVTENPMQWLMQKPQNYVGEFDGISPDAIEPGNWAFDLKSHELVYVPYRNEYFTPAKDGFKWVRYRAHLGYERTRGMSAKSSVKKGARELSSVLFEPVEPYQWLIQEKK